MVVLRKNVMITTRKMADEEGLGNLAINYYSKNMLSFCLYLRKHVKHNKITITEAHGEHLKGSHGY
jgi:hypothetical protein